ncbi:UNKNOWN [Stylonychia lemnae]|uniref:Uncharacterized protein n=1 Tax=Stylonychia lemnae TaxID=5949 RepID=A0A078A7R0_STYLE|nr:UNKNOWN [Stylonychia lemnae]|eukprot:CDW78295.1 UNKNOWN [Stylonychia lemnae]
MNSGIMRRSGMSNEKLMKSSSAMITKSKTMATPAGIKMDSKGSVKNEKEQIFEDEAEEFEDFAEEKSLASHKKQSISGLSYCTRSIGARSKETKVSTVSNTFNASQQTLNPQSDIIKKAQELPNLSSLINDQSSVGNWNSQNLIFSYFQENKVSEDFERDIKLMIKDKNLYQQVLLTILALFVLREKFDDQEDEWIMIAKKAKTYLREQGIEKVDQFYKKINITIKE